MLSISCLTSKAKPAIGEARQRRRLTLVPILLVVFFFIFSLLSFHFSLGSVQAATTDNCATSTTPLTDQEAVDKLNKCAIQKNVFDDKIFNVNQIAGTTDSIYNLLTGSSRLHPETNGVTAKSGALAASGNLIVALYSAPPASGVQYFAQTIQKLNPVKSAYAADTSGGIGFGALQPVQRAWSVFRNISYVGFVIVFVIMGFMIMFRAHISPQAVATVQDSIPRIVVALILVTFSYAIAGLMIDIMFVFLNIIVNALTAAGLLSGTTIGQDVFQKSVFGVISSNWKHIFTTVADSLANIIDQSISLGPIDKIFGFFGGTLGAIVVGIAVLFIMFRIFFMLLMAYVMIIVLTMVAPFFFLIQALPGRNGAGEWFKQMGSQIAVFPTVAIMFVFAGVLGGLGGGNGAIDAGNVGQFPLLVGGLDPAVIGKLIGIGILLMTPSAAELVRNALGVKGGPQGAFAPAGAALGAGAGVLGAGGKQLQGSPIGRAFREVGERGSRQSTFQIAKRIPGGGGIKDVTDIRQKVLS
jgi:hypothetical protein